MITADLIWFSEKLTLEIKKILSKEFKVPKANISLCASHTHGTPNPENNFQYNIDNLFVKEAYCGKQIVMKRFRPRAKGRASPIIKPYSNLTIILAEKQKEKVEKR